MGETNRKLGKWRCLWREIELYCSWYQKLIFPELDYLMDISYTQIAREVSDIVSGHSVRAHI